MIQYFFSVPSLWKQMDAICYQDEVWWIDLGRIFCLPINFVSADLLSFIDQIILCIYLLFFSDIKFCLYAFLEIVIRCLQASSLILLIGILAFFLQRITDSRSWVFCLWIFSFKLSYRSKYILNSIERYFTQQKKRWCVYIYMYAYIHIFYPSEIKCWNFSGP